jgi:peptidoglycan/xylan/chitin deacetylase (PgdA/CDA1 family)
MSKFCVDIARRIFRRTPSKIQSRLPLGCWKRLFPKHTLGVLYHMVADTPRPHMLTYPHKGPAQFERDVTWLQNRFGLLDYDEIVSVRDGGNWDKGLNKACISFDDGFRECFTLARPILKRLNAPCTFFITTHWLDNKTMFHEGKASLCISLLQDMLEEEVCDFIQSLKWRPDESEMASEQALNALKWRLKHIQLRPGLSKTHHEVVRLLLSTSAKDDAALDDICGQLGININQWLTEHKPYVTSKEVKQFAAEGFTLGGHGLSHQAIQDLDSPEAMERDIVESCAHIRDLTGQRQVPFAFPFGGAGVDREFLQCIRQRNPFVGLYFDTNELRPDRAFIVNRIGADIPDANDSFAQRLRGIWSQRTSWNPSVTDA